MLRVIRPALAAVPFVLVLGALGFACWTRIQMIHTDPLIVGHYLGPISGVSEDGRPVTVPDSDCHLLRYGSAICPACRSDRKEWAALKAGLLAKGCDVTEFAPAAELLEPGSPGARSFRLKLLNASFVARSRLRATPTMVLANRSWRVVWSQVGSLQGPEVNGILGREPEPLAIALLRPVELHLRPLPSARAQNVTGPPADASLDERTMVIPVAGSPVDGPADARVAVVEFADFQCPFCARASGPLRKLRTQFPSDVRLIYKQFPLDMHPLARPAAGLSVLAAQNGRFWTVYAALFQATPRLSPDAVREAARQAGLDWDHLSPTLDSPEVSQRIDADIALGKSVGVEGTPTLFVNGRQYHGAIDSANLERVVLAQLGRPELSRTELSRKSGGGTQR